MYSFKKIWYELQQTDIYADFDTIFTDMKRNNCYNGYLDIFYSIFLFCNICDILVTAKTYNMFYRTYKKMRGVSVKSTSNRSQQRLLCGEVLNFTREKRKRQRFSFLFEPPKAAWGLK